MRDTGFSRSRLFARKLRPVMATAGLTVGLLAFALPAPVAAQANFETQWADLIAAAKKEGALSIASGGAPSRQYRPVVDAFQTKFGIRTQVSTGNANDTVNRVLAERKAGRYAVDLAMVGIRGNNSRLVPAGALIPIAQLFIHPEVTDLSKWFGGRYWYTDEEQKYAFIYHAAIEATYSVWYNTEKVPPEEIKTLKSQWDIFEPRWKGRILGQAMSDPSGIRQLADSWNEPDRGPDWVRKYLLDAGVTFSSDRRILENWLVGGRFHLWPVTQAESELIELKDKGLPIAQLELPKQRPQLRASSSGCCLSAFDKAPNPNAAKLFVNWFLSKEGQSLTHTVIPNLDRASLRNDVPPGEVMKDHLRVTGTTYDFPDADTKSAKLLETGEKEVMKIWESRQR